MREAGYYHVYNRGCNRQPIFLDDDNYIFLLRKVKAYPLSMTSPSSPTA